MFFLRPDYRYGDPSEQPEHLDEALKDELMDFMLRMPPESETPEWDYSGIYKGPHTFLHTLAVMHAVRTITNNNPKAVTKDMLFAAAADQKNWPTRGYLMPGYGGWYEDRSRQDGHYMANRSPSDPEPTH